jgi:1-acyl-sn-glycerol-3-phosphate acyltransferase
MFSRIRIFLTAIQMTITISIVIILMYMFNKHNKIIRKIWGQIQIKLLGIKLKIEGEIDKNANMIILNHQSFVDIIVLEALHPKNISWVAKKEIANLFWFGHILKAPEMIIVERESKTSLIKLLKESKEKFEQNRPIAIFPEGTRTSGKKLHKFKAGAKLIANKYNFKVQPIVLIGTRNILDSTAMTQNSGTVKVVCLPTIQASSDTNWYDDMAIDMANILSKGIK